MLKINVFLSYIGTHAHLRFFMILIHQSIVVGEMIIYIRLYYTLRNHDEGMKNKISFDDLRQRKRKNIISLSGQVISFFVEFFISMLVIANIFNQNLVDVSFIPILFITSTSMISISQLWTSHELKRYINSKFMA